MADLEFIGAIKFSATEVRVVAKTTAGREFMARHFGDGAVEAIVPKSQAGLLLEAVATAGLVEFVC